MELQPCTGKNWLTHLTNIQQNIHARKNWSAKMQHRRRTWKRRRERSGGNTGGGCQSGEFVAE